MRAKRAVDAQQWETMAARSQGAPKPPIEDVLGPEATAALQQGRTKTLGPKIISEEEYVRGEVEATRLAIERGLKDHDGKRLDRAEAYARWRYAGYLAGEIASL